MTDAERKTLETYIGKALQGYPVDDLHAVYSAMEAKGEWEEFVDHCMSKLTWAECLPQSITAWLFCLNHSEQIPERMKLAAEWIKNDKR
jgi:hypothetical protein